MGRAQAAARPPQASTSPATSERLQPRIGEQRQRSPTASHKPSMATKPRLRAMPSAKARFQPPAWCWWDHAAWWA